MMGREECGMRKGLISIVQLRLLCAVTQCHSGQTFSCHGSRYSKGSTGAKILHIMSSSVERECDNRQLPVNLLSNYVM